MSNSVMYRFWAVLLLLGAWGCGSDRSSKPSAEVQDSAARACDKLCSKLETCSDLEGQSTSECVRGCNAAASGDAPGCSVSPDQANSCSAALDAIGCNDISSSRVPTACIWCDDARARARAAAGAPGSSSTGAGAGCAPLRACCDSMSVPEQQSLCNMVAAMNNGSLCAAVLPGYRSAGACH